jgi:hypothetical protein
MSSGPFEKPDFLGRQVCFRSNINKAGKARRMRIAQVLAVAGVAVVAATRRFFPLSLLWTSVFASIFAMGSIAVYLEVSRQTCVLLAAKGVREKTNESDAKKFVRVADTDEQRASRDTAFTIYRDALIGGVIVGALSAYAATTFF